MMVISFLHFVNREKTDTGEPEYNFVLVRLDHYATSIICYYDSIPSAIENKSIYTIEMYFQQKILTTCCKIHSNVQFNLKSMSNSHHKGVHNIKHIM